MRPLRYSINVTLDGCCDHTAIVPDEDLHRHAQQNIEEADALLFGRVTYKLMEDGWRNPVPPGTRPDWMEPFAKTINEKKKYVVSHSLKQVDWNSELLRGDLEKEVRALKNQPGKGLLTGGVALPRTLAEMRLIDEYDFLIQPRLVGHGPKLVEGLSKVVDLELVSRKEFPSGVVVVRYVPKRS